MNNTKKKATISVKMEIESGELRLEAGLDWWEHYFEIEDSFNKQLLEKRKQAAQRMGKFTVDQAQVVSNAVFKSMLKTHAMNMIANLLLLPN